MGQRGGLSQPQGWLKSTNNGLGVRGYPEEALDADHGGVVLGLFVVLSHTHTLTQGGEREGGDVARGWQTLPGQREGAGRIPPGST